MAGGTNLNKMLFAARSSNKNYRYSPVVFFREYKNHAHGMQSFTIHTTPAAVAENAHLYLRMYDAALSKKKKKKKTILVCAPAPGARYDRSK